MKKKEKEPKHEDEQIEQAQVVQDKKEDYGQLWDKYLRVCADFENSRKLWDKQRQDLVRFANYSLFV